MHEQAQLKLNVFTSIQIADYSRVDHDPYWDEIVKQPTMVDEYTPDAGSCTTQLVQEHKIAPQQVDSDRWSPSDFGEVPRKSEDSGQLTIFYDDSHEPPDPDDFKTLKDYSQAWADWELRVKYPTNYSLTSNSQTVVSEYPTNYSLTSNSQTVVSEYRSGDGVNIYTPAGTAGKDIKYFRCSCKEGSKTKHVHIPGGNTRSPLACQNAEIVRQAFAAGKRSVFEIKAVVKSLSSARRWGK